jgi:hypothetical protein
MLQHRRGQGRVAGMKTQLSRSIVHIHGECAAGDEMTACSRLQAFALPRHGGAFAAAAQASRRMEYGCVGIRRSGAGRDAYQRYAECASWSRRDAR